MTALDVLRSTPVPPRLQKLPLDPRGYPIFWSITQDNGKYDFKHIPMPKIVQAGKNRLCGLCGETIYGDVVFIGGPQSCKNRVFSDPPMHDECARYAWQVCPYITRLGWHREKTEELDEINPHGILAKPENMALYTCRAYILFQTEEGYPLFRAYPPVSVEWRQEPE